MYYLQFRWKLLNGTLLYHGIRSGDKLNKNVIKLSARQEKIIKLLPCELNEKQIKILGKVICEGAVGEGLPALPPANLKEAVFCKNCSANDFTIPGLQFDKNGLCPMCEHSEKTAVLTKFRTAKNRASTLRYSILAEKIPPIFYIIFQR